MKRVLLMTLIALNLGLLACILHVTSPKAQGQAIRGAADYLAVTGKIDGSTEALFITDLAKRRMMAWTPNPVNGRLQLALRGTDLSRDFGRDRHDND